MKKIKWEIPVKTYKYSAKKPFLTAYAVLIFIGILLTIGRWYSVFNHDFVIINAEVCSHISNFSLSLVAYVGIGYSWLLFGTSFRFIIILGLFLIIGNFACETLMEFMNTPDIVDAVYGTFGVLAAYVYLFFTHKYGLIERPLKNG